MFRTLITDSLIQYPHGVLLGILLALIVWRMLDGRVGPLFIGGSALGWIASVFLSAAFLDEPVVRPWTSVAMAVGHLGALLVLSCVHTPERWNGTRRSAR